MIRIVLYPLELLLRLFGIKVTRTKVYEELLEKAKWVGEFKKIQLKARAIKVSTELLQELIITAEDARQGLAVVNSASSQLGQDLFALFSSDFRRDGFFVEVGAADGEALSNTYMLEKDFDWTGILVEPESHWWPSLQANRKAKLEKLAVYRTSGDEVQFLSSGYLSTIASHAGQDLLSQKGKVSSIPTITLTDLLIRNKAPSFIDFLSLDTEGSELDILEALDFSKYRFGAMCVEHNFTANEIEIQKLLERRGYVRVLDKKSAFDAWYLSEENFRRRRW